MKRTTTNLKARRQRSRKTALTYGGVSTMIEAPAANGLRELLKPSGAINQAAAHPNFTYHGGPVIVCPLVYASFWGNGWLTNPDQLVRAGRLTQYLRDLVRSKYMNILSQYGSGFGAGSGAFIRSSFVTNVPMQFTDASIHTVIQQCINAGVLPEPTKPSNTALIIFLDENMGVNDPNGIVMCEPHQDTAFGYHNFFTTSAAHPCYYAIIPALNNTCLTESCGNDASCSLHLGETQEQRQTQVVSHEFAEMVTDPELNAWYDSNGSENGDICNGNAGTITVGSNTWTVQRMYSKYDDIQSNGAVTCVTEPPNPLPKLTPGPASRPAMEARARTMPPFDRLLPLPPVHYDAKAHQVKIDEKALHEYAHQLFYPLQVEHVMADLPSFLREAADILTKA